MKISKLIISRQQLYLEADARDHPLRALLPGASRRASPSFDLAIVSSYL
jgi:hypothetical protein